MQGVRVRARKIKLPDQMAAVDGSGLASKHLPPLAAQTFEWKLSHDIQILLLLPYRPLDDLLPLFFGHA